MRRILILAVAVALAAGFGGASAYFTDQAQVPENIIRAGTVAVSAEPTASALSIDSLAPGTPVSRSLRLVNNGSIGSSVVLSQAKKMGITAFYEALTCTVTHGARVIYTGPLSGLKTQPVVLEPGVAADLEVVVLLPSDASDGLADDYVKLTLYADAEQLR